MPPGARPVSAETELRPGTQVLVKYATTTQAFVIQLVEDGQVKIRPHGRDSRGDAVLSRDKLMLYPEELLKPEVPAKYQERCSRRTTRMIVQTLTKMESCSVVQTARACSHAAELSVRWINTLQQKVI